MSGEDDDLADAEDYDGDGPAYALSRALEGYDAGEQPEGDSRHYIGRLLGELDGDAFEAMRDQATAVLHLTDADRLDAWRECKADPDLAREDLEDLLAEYEDEDERPNGDDLFDIGRLLGQATDDAFEDLSERAADVLECEDWAVERHRDLERYRWSFGTDEPVQVVADDGKMWRISGGVPRRRSREPILNFTMDPQAILDMDFGDEQIELAIDFDGRTIHRSVTADVFHERSRFNEGVRKEGGMLFRPQESVHTALEDLNYHVYAQDAPRLKGTVHIGLHGDEWVIPGASLTPDGWTDEPDIRYVEQDIALERHLNLPTDRDEYDADDVARILRELPKTRPSERLLPVLGWFWAAPFRPHITEVTNEFNLLNVTGDTGSGKTTTLRYLWECFGVKGKPMSASDTPFTVTRALGATNALPIWHDEYRTGDIRYLDYYHNLIRKAATGGIEQRGNANQSTNEFDLQAPLVISGEEKLRPPAERRRSVLVTFKKTTAREGSPYREAYKNLTGEGIINDDDELVIADDAPQPVEHALAYFRWVAAQDHEEVVERWRDAKRAVAARRAEWSEEVELGDMEEQGLQVVVFGWGCYRDFAEEMGVDADELPSEREVDRALQYVADASSGLTHHAEQLLELATQAAGQGAVEEDQDYRVVYAGTDRETLRLALSRVYANVSKYVREYDLNDDLLGNYEDYRERFRERYHDDEDDLLAGKEFEVFTHGVGTDCISIDTSVADETIDGFDSRVFTGRGEPDGEGESTDAATPIIDLEERRGYQTLTATVLTLDTDIPEGGPSMAGTLEDRTGIVDFVSWEEPDDLAEPIEEDGTYLFEDAHVGEYDGATQVELREAAKTKIEPIQRGAGHTAPADAERGQGRLAASDGGGKVEGVTGTVAERLRLHHEKNDEVRVAGIAGATNLSPDDARHGLDKLAKRGDLLRGDDDDTFIVK